MMTGLPSRQVCSRDGRSHRLPKTLKRIGLLSAERSKHTGGWFPLPRATTVSTTILAPELERTIYSYIDVGLLDARNIDLRRKLRRPERKKSGPVLRVDRKCHIGHSYEEYKEYMRQNPDAMVSQMDSVLIHSVG